MADLPPLNGLRAFEAAGRRLTFRAAAEDLGVTQGAVAQQVRQLEGHLGVQLFDRVPKGLSFTPPGRTYHAHVTAAFDELRAATGDLKPEPGKVLVSVTPTFAAKWLIPNMPSLSAAHPEIELRILATEKVSSFHSDGIDLAVRQGQPPFGASLDAVLLFRQETIAVAAPSLVAGASLPLDPGVLSTLPKLHDAHDLWPEFFRSLGMEDRSTHGLRMSQTALAVDAALSGQGVALVNRFLVARELAARRLVQAASQTLTGQQDFYLLAERRPNRRRVVAAVMEWFATQADLSL
ncbi:MAG: LysR substrate-binding domain-containing protein [Pseudomonadota bacterium]